jgi:hypothetical protein
MNNIPTEYYIVSKQTTNFILKITPNSQLYGLSIKISSIFSFCIYLHNKQ